MNLPRSVSTIETHSGHEHCPDPALLVGKDVSVQIQNTTILQEIQFTLTSGTITGLIGPNGCGKTTLLRAICGYLPYTGSIVLKNKEIIQWNKRMLARQVSFVRQAPWHSFDFTVEELVLLGLIPHKSLLQDITPKDHEFLNMALSDVGLSGYNQRSIRSLSGGERQRAYLAQAMVQNSHLLLLDEPTTHLDINHQYQFLELIKGLRKQGKTILAVFHDLELASKYSDHLIVLHQGCMVTSGSPTNVLDDKLLADVFRMNAKVHITADQGFTITYFGAL
ncbi:MAG: ABC transporter ATP-binding protein [Bacteroidetes bacterium]|nr:ABC transporter ATP-binding protein [Bacteroidota bacterium]